MKIRLYKRQIRLLCNWYVEEVMNTFPQLRNRLITPAYEIELIRALTYIQEKQKTLEPYNDIWNVKIKPIFNKQQHMFEVIVEDMSNILVIDFDNSTAYWISK